MPEGPTSTGSKHRPATEPDRPDAGSLLCVANFPSNTGYAWTFIEELYAAIADRLALCGIHTWVAYPSLNGEPVPLAGSAASPFEHVVRLDRLSSVRATAEFVRRHRVRVVYLCDRSVWHPAYALLHLAGARRIIVHDHTSGERTPPRGLKRLAKRWRRGLPGAQADIVIGVSDYVMRRKVEVDLVPPSRVWRVWNSIRLRSESPLKEMLEERLGLNPLRPVIACAARAAEVKGVDHLLRAFDRLSASTDAGPARPTLLYLGDGPFMPELRRIRAALASRGDIVLAGYREDAAELLAAADVCVVPSVWAEAFCLSALEPMAHGVPVVASRVGGIPEVVVDGESGLLVPPGDEQALEQALRHMLSDPEERRRLGEAGRRRAHALFSRERQMRELLPLVFDGFRPLSPMHEAGEADAITTTYPVSG
jgi:glycosyltransferase involved in cell wall biosynthesis